MAVDRALGQGSLAGDLGDGLARGEHLEGRLLRAEFGFLSLVLLRLGGDGIGDLDSCFGFLQPGL